MTNVLPVAIVSDGTPEWPVAGPPPEEGRTTRGPGDGPTRLAPAPSFARARARDTFERTDTPGAALPGRRLTLAFRRGDDSVERGDILA
jgi:hypothetical protein